MSRPNRIQHIHQLLQAIDAGILTFDESFADAAATDEDRILLWATSNGYIDVVRAIVDDLPSTPTSTPRISPGVLRMASAYGQVDIVEAILPLSEPSADDSAALRAAAIAGHLDVVSTLLAHTTDISAVLSAVDAHKFNPSAAIMISKKRDEDAATEAFFKDSATRDPLLSDRLKNAVTARDVGFIRELLPRVKNERDLTGALVNAAMLGYIEIVSALLPRLSPEQKHGFALTQAASYGHAAIVDLLVDKESPSNNHTALIAAIEEGCIDVVRAILPFYDPRAFDSDALICAAREGHVEITRMLLPLSDPSAQKNAALRIAARAGNTEIVAALLPVVRGPIDTWPPKYGHTWTPEVLNLVQSHLDDVALRRATRQKSSTPEGVPPPQPKSRLG